MLRDQIKLILDQDILSERSDEVTVSKNMTKIRDIIAELKSYIRKENVSAVAAPEIGYKSRIICVKFSNNEIKTFINPIITKAEGFVISEEVSKCVPDKRFLVPRNNSISIMYTEPMGKIQSYNLSGIASAIVQQEIQVLDGILISDIGIEIDSMYDEATEEEKNEFIAAYLDTLDLKEKYIQEQIEKEPEALQLSKAIEYMTGVETGEIHLEHIDKSTPNK